jgi:hypothetical protein
MRLMSVRGRSRGQDAIHRRPPDAKPPCDLGWPDPLLRQCPHFSGLRPRRRLAPLISTLGFRLGNSFSLALQHHLALEAGYRPDDREYQLPRRRAHVDAKSKDLKVRPLALHALDDIEEVLRGAGEPVEFGDTQDVALAHEIEGSLKLPAFPYRRDLLLKDFSYPAAVSSLS